MTVKWTVGAKIGGGFGLALAVLVVMGIASFRSIATLADTTERIDHTHRVLERLGDVLSGMKDAETGQRGYLITGEDRYLDPFHAAHASVTQGIKAVRDLTQDNVNQQRRLETLEELIDGKDGKFVELQKTIDARQDKTRGFAAAVQLVLTDKGKAVMDDIRRTVAEMESEENVLLKVRFEIAQDSARGTTRFIVFSALAAFVGLALAGMVITRNIAGPLKEISATADRIAAGDLSVTLATNNRQDEVGVLARTFVRMTDSLRGMAGVADRIAAGDLRVNVEPQSDKDVLGNALSSMVRNLRQLTGDITEGVNVLSSSANEISTSMTQLASSASQSAVTVSETTATVEQVRQTAQMASQKAKHVADSGQKAGQISQSGRKSTDDVSAGMARIRQQMDAIAASMGRLSEQSQTIGQIIATVEDLAAQSNLLAVNAAIEAAKAGEHGKGFGVVAQEVKSLAEQSRQATNQVRTILSDIQKATTTAVLATEQGSKAVDAGTRQTEVAGESIAALADGVMEAARTATQIAASSQQQLVGVDQVAAAMESIKQASTQNVTSAKQLESAARTLTDLGQRLKQTVQLYKV